MSAASQFVRAVPNIRRLAIGLLASAACLFVFTSTGSATPGVWQRQRTSSLAWLHAVFFLDQKRGWVVGSRGTLMTTENGGTTWRTSSRPTEDTIRDIYFSDEQNGWLVCERNIYDLRSNDEPRAYLLRTGDAGQSWSRVNMSGANVDARLTRAIFTRSGRGWAFGEAGAIYTTNDLGANWIKLKAPTRFLLLGGAFIDDSGWLVGAGSTILQTSDAGETWHHARLSNADNVRFNSTSFASARLGWAVGSGGAIYRTINGGRSWQSQISGVATDLFDVKFLDAVEGWAVGAEGTVLHTTDGGLHWSSERTGTPHTLERIFFADRTHGWAVGFGGTIISYGRAEAPRLRR